MTADSLQVHGGIGFTWEHDLHFFLKRAKVDGALFGSAREHRDRVADLHAASRAAAAGLAHSASGPPTNWVMPVMRWRTSSKPRSFSARHDLVALEHARAARARRRSTRRCAAAPSGPGRS